MIPTREELTLAVDEAVWGLLRAHLERGGLIVVARDLDIVEVGVKLAADRGVEVRVIIDSLGEKYSRPPIRTLLRSQIPRAAQVPGELLPPTAAFAINL